MDLYLVQTAAERDAVLATRDSGTRIAWPKHSFVVV